MHPSGLEPLARYAPIRRGWMSADAIARTRKVTFATRFAVQCDAFAALARL
jgi:hypothetical protein